MTYDFTRRGAIFGIVASLGSFSLPKRGEASPWEEVGYDRLWVNSTHGEELNIRHWDGQEYEPQAVRLLSWLWRDWRDNDAAVYIDPMMFTFLANIQTNLSITAGRPCRITLNSGYRTPQRNAGIEGAAQASYHTRGMASDFTLRSYGPDDVWRMASALNVSGLGRYRNFTHVDTGAAGRRWAGKGLRL